MSQKMNPITKLYRSFSSAQRPRSSNVKVRHDNDWEEPDLNFPERIPYSRPHFLSLSPEDETEICDHKTRPIVTPLNNQSVPLEAGYAECINGGKSPKNEDQAAVGSFTLTDLPEQNGCNDNPGTNTINIQYYAIFDGHAGPGAALMAASHLINHLQERLVDVRNDLFSLSGKVSQRKGKAFWSHQNSSVDDLVRGALEQAFVSLDEQISVERQTFRISGGCTALVCLVMLGKLYLAHAGDGRAIALIGDQIVTMAREFTPETDAERIQMLAFLKPELMCKTFSDHCFVKPITKKDVGTRVLCRPPNRSGWHYKEVTDLDAAQPPLVAGQGKWARLMGVLGVTRGFGDHYLNVPGTNIPVKPFLTAVPEVRILNLLDYTLTNRDILIMGCDGMWDMLTSETVAATARKELDSSMSHEEENKYSRVAASLVQLARGENLGNGWRLENGNEASFDDITVFVIPLIECLNEQMNSTDLEINTSPLEVNSNSVDS